MHYNVNDNVMTSTLYNAMYRSLVFSKLTSIRLININNINKLIRCMHKVQFLNLKETV